MRATLSRSSGLHKSRVSWLAVAAVAAVLLAFAGALYVERDSPVSHVVPTPVMPMAPVATKAVAASSPAAALSTAPQVGKPVPDSPSPGIAEAAQEPSEAPTAPASSVSRTAAKKTSRNTATAPVAPDKPTAKPAHAPAALAEAAAGPAPAPRTPAEPRAQCGNMNFIAAARCMASQCLKPEFKAHAQCEEVRRQQRLEEEKRNPSLAN